MKNATDVVVVGGGPCGSFAAYNLARLGADVTVFEEHNEIGVPSHCAGHLSIGGLEKLGLYPLGEEIVENTFYGAIFHSPTGNRFSVRFSSPVTCTVNRTLFDKHVARIAQTAGVHYQLSSYVDSLIMEDGFAKGVVVRQDGRIKQFRTNVVIDAEGVSSRILKKTGLQTLDRLMLVDAVQAEVEVNEEVETDVVQVFFGKDYAAGFYAWLIPLNNCKAKVGLATNSGNPKELLQKLIKKHPAVSRKLAGAEILRTAFHPITLGGSIPKAYSNGFLAVGDVASQVKPTTGGGVILGMTSARIAAEVASKALQEHDYSSKLLGEYEKRWCDSLGFDMRVMLRMRRFLTNISDKTFDNAIGLCSRIGLDKTLQSIKDIDFQGQSLLRALCSPRMAVALVYFFYLYLSANP